MCHYFSKYWRTKQQKKIYKAEKTKEKFFLRKKFSRTKQSFVLRKKQQRKFFQNFFREILKEFSKVVFSGNFLSCFVRNDFVIFSNNLVVFRSFLMTTLKKNYIYE